MFRRFAVHFGKVSHQFGVYLLQKRSNVNVVAVRAMQPMVLDILYFVAWFSGRVHIAPTHHQQVVEEHQNSKPGAGKHAIVYLVD